ncbi:MAG TPA: MBOAT family protein, partial [Leptospiraceae bacterium]|nr:MBOAT family protein [Leptospiraceae bacterium]
MLFNSLEYFIFFSAVFIYQWYLHPLLFSGRENSRQILHSFLLGASYIFYMSWDWRFSGLIFLSTLIDYVLALKIDAEEDSAARLAWLRLSLFLNLIVILGFFKYYNFFASSSNSLLSLLGLGSPVPVIKNLILPVGISFFTFQSMSYTIDVYRRHI